jgi:hypothetical protein
MTVIRVISGAPGRNPCSPSAGLRGRRGLGHVSASVMNTRFRRTAPGSRLTLGINTCADILPRPPIRASLAYDRGLGIIAGARPVCPRTPARRNDQFRLVHPRFLGLSCDAPLKSAETHHA